MSAAGWCIVKRRPITFAGYASSNFAMTSVSASPSRVHSWNAGSAIIVSLASFIFSPFLASKLMGLKGGVGKGGREGFGES